MMIADIFPITKHTAGLQLLLLVCWNIITYTTAIRDSADNAVDEVTPSPRILGIGTKAGEVLLIAVGSMVALSLLFLLFFYVCCYCCEERFASVEGGLPIMSITSFDLARKRRSTAANTSTLHDSISTEVDPLTPLIGDSKDRYKDKGYSYSTLLSSESMHQHPIRTQEPPLQAMEPT